MLKRNKNRKLQNSPFEAALNNCFVNYQGSLCFDLSKSKDQIAIQLRAERLVKEEKERQTKMLKKYIGQLKALERKRDFLYNEAAKARGNDEVNSEDLYWEAVKIVKRIQQTKRLIASCRKVL